jgi:hypothetical protein
MKVFTDTCGEYRYYSYRRAGFRENDCNAFGSAWICVVDNENRTKKNCKYMLRGVWKLWGRHTISLTDRLNES